MLAFRPTGNSALYPPIPFFEQFATIAYLFKYARFDAVSISIPFTFFWRISLIQLERYPVTNPFMRHAKVKKKSCINFYDLKRTRQ